MNTQTLLFEVQLPKNGSKRVQGGITTSELIMSAHIDINENIFPQILALHVPKGSRIADVTWGKGVFWKNVSDDDYDLLATDISTGVDCRNLPYEDTSLDCIVLDPPYMEGFYRNQASVGWVERQRNPPFFFWFPSVGTRKVKISTFRYNSSRPLFNF